MCSSSLLGVDAVLVDVCCVLRPGRRYAIPGHSPAASRESEIRVRSALAASGIALPDGATVEFSTPRPTPTSIPQLDLAIAVAILATTGIASAPAGLVVLGELGLDGSVRAVRGVLAAALAARAAGMPGAVVPRASAWEAALVEGLTVYAVDDLGEAVEALRGELPPFVAAPDRARRPDPVDFAEVRGQDAAVRELARAAGQHAGILLSGPPGTGKTMLARRLSTLLPEMTPDERREALLSHSATGLANAPLDARPFRAPHYTISTSALVGDVGPTRRPGEVQLAIHGVLYLDEVAEFSSGALMELARALRQIPARLRPRVVASAARCPCGWSGTDGVAASRSCACSDAALARHRLRIQQAVAVLGLSVTVEVPVVALAEMRAATPGPSSAELRALVQAPRAEA